MKKVCSKAKVNLDKKFLPKRKRVLNKCTLKVLNAKSKKKKKVAQPQPLESVTHDLLDSQSSIGACFLESQSRSQVDGPASPLASHVPFSQSQTESVSSPVQQAAQHPSECHACLFMHAAYTYTCTYATLVFSATAEIIFKSLQEAIETIGSTCPSCKTNKNLIDSLSRALENAEKLIKLESPVTPE